MSNSFSILSPIRKSSWSSVVENKSNSYFRYGKPFVQLVQGHPHYGYLMEVDSVYEVELVHREGCHWYVLVKTQGSTLPYVSLEVRTTNLSDLVEFCCSQDSLNAGSSTSVGVYKGTLNSLCHLADTVVKEMDSYDLLSSNCQTFCNKLLKRMGKKEFPTSTELLDREIDLLEEVIVGTSPSPSVSYVPKPKTRQWASSLINKGLGATAAAGSSVVACRASTDREEQLDLVLSKTVPPLSISDLAGLKKILIPIAHKWKEIGESLSLSSEALDKIKIEYKCKPDQCLREMLREYLEQGASLPSWDDIVSAVKEYSSQVAKSIIKRAESIH